MKRLKSNSIQFAVVREDSEIEVAVFKKYKIKNPILIGSGGCTALNLSCFKRELPLNLIEPNQAQIQLIKKKTTALRRIKNTSELKYIFGVSNKESSPNSLIEIGNFESLFRQFRKFIFEFIADEKDILKLFKENKTQRWKKVFEHPYWSVAFDLFFSDSILRTMFGDAAIQHAPKDSYNNYFKKVIEAGLLNPNARNNYFLHHILLGRYLDNSRTLPRYLVRPPHEILIKFENKLAEDVLSYKSYDFAGLSNIFDWMSEKQVQKIATKLGNDLAPGSVVLFRQLNNKKDFTSFFGSKFYWDTKLADKLQSKDRSLFYQSLHIGIKK